MNKPATAQTPAPGNGKAKTQKGARTRAALKDAARRVLETTPYHEIRISDITNEAGVATGLYYHYFPDLKSLLIELVEDIIGEIEDVDAKESEVKKGDWFGLLKVHVRVVVDAYMRQPGMMRCLAQMSSESPELAALWRRSIERRIGFLVDHLDKIFPQVQFSEKERVFFSYALGGVGDVFLQEYFIHRLGELCRFKASADEIAELIATMYYRALFAGMPEDGALNHWPSLGAMRK